jgi:fibronectin type 3 domain-containing protein
VGPIAPPSPQIPAPVNNLAVVERGNQLIVTFTTPSHTTDALPIQRFSDVDLRIGPSVTPFDFERWAALAKPYDRPLLENTDSDGDNPDSIPVTVKIPVSEWEGKRVDVAVRTSVRKGEHYSQWSNRVSLDVIPPLSPPQVKWDATREGYKLTWPEKIAEVRYDVLRQGPGEKAFAMIGTAEKPEYVDTTSQWDTPYTYEVIAKKGAAESLPSDPVKANHPDTFPPSVPTSIVALAGPDSVEVTWSRSPEADTKGYYVYRSTNGGPFERQGDLVTIPTFSDHKVEHGKTYRYVISAVDQKNNPSENSAPVDVTFP